MKIRITPLQNVVIDGVIYRAKQDSVGTCRGCAFINLSMDDACYAAPCTCDRLDGKHVIFVSENEPEQEAQDVVFDIPNNVQDLRDAGYSVVIFTPEELQGANTNNVAERLCELGWDVINDLKPEERS